MKKIVSMILVSVLMIMVLGCDRTESRLVGKWVGTTGTLEFFKNKTGIMNPPKERLDLPINVWFTWNLIDKDSVRLNVNIRGGITSVAKLEGKKTIILEGDRFVKED